MKYCNLGNKFLKMAFRICQNEGIDFLLLKIFEIYLETPISFIGLVGNLLILYGMFRCKRTSKSVRFYYMIIALGDIGFIIFESILISIPDIAVPYFFGCELSLNLLTRSEFCCKGLKTIKLIFENISRNSLMCFMMETIWAVKYPFQFKKYHNFVLSVCLFLLINILLSSIYVPLRYENVISF